MGVLVVLPEVVFGEITSSKLTIHQGGYSLKLYPTKTIGDAFKLQDQTLIVMKNNHQVTFTYHMKWCQQPSLYIFTLPPPFAS
ncbi:hypothetical protein M23134_01870 [Microscilla marina ATCC 23134]|uniref:Uncharacterized protein n=1 Tax=Microscilla marina ATCC 23134 TaxID=313606 RepID=A1ZC39_MICM2|nr:hypothetical protein M23134_01870 [Microscilla marina ATCC 23134]